MITQAQSPAAARAPRRNYYRLDHRIPFAYRRVSDADSELLQKGQMPVNVERNVSPTARLAALRVEANLALNHLRQEDPVIGRYLQTIESRLEIIAEKLFEDGRGDFRKTLQDINLSASGVAFRVDWPIEYHDLEPYYTKVEQVVGVSGRIEPHPNIEPRSTADFPYPPTAEHPISAQIDSACAALGYHSLRVPRAVLSQAKGARRSCEYSGYCGSYGCSSGAKGSARAALLDDAVATGRCEIRPHSHVLRLRNDARGKIVGAEYVDRDGNIRLVDARIYVVACQAIETSRLLLSSVGPQFRNGLANNSGQVGKNLLFSAGGSGSGDFELAGLTETQRDDLRRVGPFVNRALDDWYEIADPAFNLSRRKGGIVEFLFAHPNPTSKANGLKWGDDGLIWGTDLKRRLESWFRTDRTLQFEVFNDWLPTDDCNVSLDPTVTDKFGKPVARVRIGYHPHDLEVGRYLLKKGEAVLKHMGAVRIGSSASGSPPANLVAGGCRFGVNPDKSVLDPDCRAHDIDNLYVTDGSFMPTGGSVPYTWTIYANAFRVADRIAAAL